MEAGVPLSYYNDGSSTGGNRNIPAGRYSPRRGVTARTRLEHVARRAIRDPRTSRRHQLMFDNLISAATVKALVATALTVVVFVALFRALRALQRLVRPASDRATFSDLPALVHGPQEAPTTRSKSEP